MRSKTKNLVVMAALLVAVGAGVLVWQRWNPGTGTEGLVKGNGRTEATEIDIATQLPGRVQDILVDEGAFVEAGQVLARMDVQTLNAQRAEAQAMLQQAQQAVAGAQAQVALRQSDVQAVQALVVQRETELDSAQRRLQRVQALAKDGMSTGQDLDDARAKVVTAQATLTAARAQVRAAQAAVNATQTQVSGAQASVAAVQATLERIAVALADSELKAPRAGRVQYRVAQAGEVLGGGGKVLNLVDLSDVYLTFFLPETVAGQVALGSEVRIVLDAAPQFVIPAKVSFVANTAQFTPKTVETASERQKLMFRVKAQIDRELLLKNVQQVKTGLPGVAWVKLDPQAPWPAELAVKVTP